MAKRDRMEEVLRGLGASCQGSSPYTAWFDLFNQGRYYEAHDVVEHIWLPSRDPFLKGLIQIAGGFVHLQKHQARPGHPKDARRLRPACRLLLLGVANVRQFGSPARKADTQALCELCLDWVRRMESGEYRENPWSPDSLPQLKPPGSK